MVPFTAIVIFITSWVLLLLEVDPVPTWFYVFAWYSLLIVANHCTKRSGRRAFFSSGPRTVSLFGWSAVIWLVFEAVNFRLRNWYYVFLPAVAVERWIGIVVSFATVIPAIFVAERLLDDAGVAHGARSAPLRWTARQLSVAQFLGMAMALLAVIVPRTFFPLAWGAALLIADPIVLRRRPEASLFNDLASGSWGRILRLMLAGLAVGLVWEFLNFWARGKWIYTVPWLEQTKLFEMPPLGFLGFPFFALEAWAMYHAVSGVSRGSVAERQDVIARGRPRSRSPTQRGRVVVAAVFSIFVLMGMERWTISSVSPRLADTPGMSPASASTLDAAGIGSPFELARADPDALTDRTDLSAETVHRSIEAARLVTLRGIGTAHATRLAMIDVATVCQLARQQPGTLRREYHSAPRPHDARLPGRIRPTPAEVRVWIDAARRSCSERFQVPARH